MGKLQHKRFEVVKNEELGAVPYTFKFGHCSDVKFGAYVKAKYLTDVRHSN